MDVKQLRYFVHVAESGSFTGAASLLRVSQTAIGVQIRNLEGQLGVQLLHRHSRGVEPTQAGLLLLEHASVILRQVERATKDLVDLSGAPHGRVAIGITPTVSRVTIPSLVQRCTARYPEVVLVVSERPNADVVRGLVEDRFDIAFSSDPSSASGVQSWPLFVEDLFFVGPAAMDDNGADRIDLARVIDYPLVLPSRPHGLRVLMDDSTARAGYTLRIGSEIDSTAIKREMVCKGMGFTVLPYGAVGEEVAAGMLFAKLIVNPQISRTLHLVQLRKRPQSRAVAVVREMIEQLVAENIASGICRWRPVHQ